MNAPTHYLLHLADNALILGQRNAEWCGHGPVLEEDIAMANIGLDLIGQSRLLYQHAAAQLGNTSEDQLAYFRDAQQFRNYVLLELPHRTAFAPNVAADRDYAVTIARNFLYSSLMILVWDALQNSSDPQLAAIAAKTIKETRYHLRHSTDWMLRLGDGTPESHMRMQAALDYLMPYTQEFWAQPAIETVAVDATVMHHAWETSVNTVVAEATLKPSSTKGYATHGKDGQHSEHLSYLLAEMQSLARAHPEATW